MTIRNFIPKKKTGFDRMEQMLRMLNRQTLPYPGRLRIHTTFLNF